MKKYILFTAITISILFSFSCRENSEVINQWDSPSLSNIHVTPINGGAKITYEIPDNSEIMYIEAQYVRNEVEYNEKSSIYKNEIIIEGFNTEDPVDVILYKVNRKGERSTSASVNFVPLISPIKMIFNSLKLSTTFGGIVAEWENPTKTEIGVRFSVDSIGILKTQKMYYSEKENEVYDLRGYPDSLINFVVSLEDKWGNFTDTIMFITKPYFETEVKKPFGDMRQSIPYDNITDLSTALDFKRTYDGIVGNMNGFLTNPGHDGLSVTWDLGVVVKLSRMTLWPRADAGWAVFASANVLEFEIWGIDKLDPTKLPPADPSYWLDEWSVRNGAFENIPIDYVMPERTFKDDWVYLGKYEIDTDQPPVPIITLGNKFNLPEDAAPVRYIRFYCHNSYGISPPANNYFAIGEISFFGDTTVPQE